MPASSVARLLPALLLVTGFALSSWALPAAAQDAQTLDRINRLENDLRTLQRQVYRGGTAPNSGPASPAGSGGSLTETGSDGSSPANRLNARIDELENQIRQMIGRFEEVEFSSSQANRRIDKLVEDVDFRLNQLERGGQPQGQQSAPQTGSVEQVKPSAQQQGVPAPGTPVQQQQNLARGSTSSTPGQAPTKEGVLGSMPVDAQGRPLPGSASGSAPAAQQQTARAPTPPAASGKGKLPAGSPQERYNYAYKLLVQSDYADAESAFREFIGAHPQDALAGNAQYWLGETYYVRQQYEPAAQAFLQGYQGYPKGAKAPDSLLKLGMSLAAMKKNPEACAALGQLGKEFASAPPHVKDAAIRERNKLGCK
ncbi:MAG: tol-pal system protein YbgF [Ferrovibrio sp.]|uniref:tol-pal system protein YbgF n=1 Tax=Ferrovibrio sp. TaxID=1917215 RepID=UPI00262F8439|nr:tol-pal system protein YbgF [Ferrovibrio sp.]MCW0233803.1 tol-pal system protein YbgF [Ferrovibrio sp.]